MGEPRSIGTTMEVRNSMPVPRVPRPVTHLGSLRPMAILVLGAGLALSGCSGSATTAGPSASAAPLGAAQLRLSLIDQLGPRWYCDPDQFPVARADEQQRAIEQFPAMQAEGNVFRAVAARLGLDPDGPLTDPQKLAIYQTWKVATSIPFEARPDGGDSFDYVARPAAGQTTGVHTIGTIDPTGSITIVRQEPAGQPVCPICLAAGTSLRNAVRIQQFHADLTDLPAALEVWSEALKGAPMPLSPVEVNWLPVPDARLQVDLWVHVP